MIEVHSNLYVGDQTDYERRVRNQPGWSIVHACKEPYHREAVGYSVRGAPKHHPEYLIANRGHRIMLNLIDPESPAYIPKEIIDEALSFIDQHLKDGKKVLVHCNQGQSRSPGIGMLYLAKEGVIENNSFKEALVEFKKIYPSISMAGGMTGFLMKNWDKYISVR